MNKIGRVQGWRHCKTIRQSYGVNFSEAVVLGRHNEYICVIAKTRHGYNDWWVDPEDIVKTEQKLLDDRDLELAKIVSTICYDEIYVTDEDEEWDDEWVASIYHSPIYVGLRNKTDTIFEVKPDNVLEWLKERNYTSERTFYSTTKE